MNRFDEWRSAGALVTWRGAVGALVIAMALGATMIRLSGAHAAPPAAAVAVRAGAASEPRHGGLIDHSVVEHEALNDAETEVGASVAAYEH